MCKKSLHRSNGFIFGLGLISVVLIVVVVAIIRLTRSSSGQTTEEVAQSYLDFILLGDEAGARQLTQFDTDCLGSKQSMHTEITRQTAVFALADIRNLTIETYPATGPNYPSSAEAADINFEFQTGANPLWQPAYLWIVTIPQAQNRFEKAICQLGGSSLIIPE